MNEVENDVFLISPFMDLMGVGLNEYFTSKVKATYNQSQCCFRFQQCYGDADKFGFPSTKDAQCCKSRVSG